MAQDPALPPEASNTPKCMVEQLDPPFMNVSQYLWISDYTFSFREVLENWATSQTEICLLVGNRPLSGAQGHKKCYFHLLPQLLFGH